MTRKTTTEAQRHGESLFSVAKVKMLYFKVSLCLCGEILFDSDFEKSGFTA
jgi:hypothetical protein